MLLSHHIKHLVHLIFALVVEEQDTLSNNAQHMAMVDKEDNLQIEIKRQRALI